MEKWGKPFIAGLISANACAVIMIIALFATMGGEWIVLVVAVPVLLVLPQLALTLYCRWTNVPPPPWWHGLVYLGLGTLFSFPLFFLMAYIVEAAFDNQISPLLFWTIYAFDIALIGMILLVAYRILFSRRKPLD